MTACMIARKHGRSVRAIVCVFDGRPGCVGRKLLNGYDAAAVMELLARGDIETLGDTPAECTSDPRGSLVRILPSVEAFEAMALRRSTDYLYLLTAEGWRFGECIYRSGPETHVAWDDLRAELARLDGPRETDPRPMLPAWMREALAAGWKPPEGFDRSAYR